MARWFLDRSHQAGIPSVNLRTLLPEARFIGCRELVVTGCAADHRRLEPGQAYVSLQAESAASNRSLHQAIERGAAAVIVEQPAEAPGSLQVIVPNARLAYARITHALAGSPSDRLQVYAVMGRQGRTAAAWTLRSILESAGLRPGFVGASGWNDGVRAYPPSAAPVEPANLVEMLAAMEDRGCLSAVIEVSPEAASRRILEAVSLAGALFLPLGAPDADQASRQQSRRDHSRIARRLRSSAPVVVAVDDHEASLLSSANLAARRMTCSSHQPADMQWKADDEGPKGSTLHLVAGPVEYHAEVGWLGAANHAGAAAATALAVALKLDRHAIIAGLEDENPIPGSLELLSFAQGIPVWTEQGSSPYELASALDSLRSVITGRLLCILCTPHRNRLELARPLAEACEFLADQVVLTLDTATTLDDNLRALRAWFHRAGRVRVEEDREQAIAAALQIARPGDGILIAGPSHSTIRATDGRATPVDDRHFIRRHLPDHAARRSA